MDSKRVKKIFCIIGLCWGLFLILGSKVFAETTPKVLPCTLTYRATLQQAIDNSFDIKMASLDIDISKAELKATRADLFPTLYTQVNTEYNNGLGNQANINYVGNTVVSSYTQFRNLASVGLSYNLFDFGAINKKVLIAKKDVEQKRVMVDLQVKDLKLKVLDAYTKTLQATDEIKTKSEILKVYDEMFKAKERLFKAGTTDKVSVMDEAVKIARTQDDIETSKLDLKNALNDLSSYTLQKYNPENLEVLDFDQMNIESNIKPVNFLEPLKAKVSEGELDLSFNPEKSLESKYYDFEIEKKKAELEMYKRQRLPSFKFYTNYLMYGQDPNQYWESFSSFKQASLAFGISGSYAFFDGFKNKASKEKASLEIKKLQLEKEKKLTEIKTNYEKSYASYETYTQELVIKKDLLSKVKEKLSAVDRMFQGGLIERNDLLSTKADLLSQEFDLQKNIINISSKIKEIEIMSGRDNV
jgi:outer membrane protein TolC